MSSLPSLMIFERCRPTMIFAALVLRRPTIVAEIEFKSIPWSRFPDRLDSRKLLHDILADCPELFVVRDRIIQTQQSQAKKSAQLRQALNKVQEVYDNLQRWNSLWGPHECTEIPPSTNTPVIVNSAGSTTLAWSSVFQFESFYQANILTLHYAILILVLRFRASIRVLLGESEQDLSQQQEIYNAGLFICRSVDFHLNQTWTELGTFNLLFPMRMAYEAVGRNRTAVGIWLETMLDDISAGRKGLWRSAKAMLEIG
jgi:hypothetical protein